MIHEDANTKKMIEEIIEREPGMSKAGTVREAVIILHSLTYPDRRPDIAADSLYRVQKQFLQKAHEENLNSDSCFMMESFLKSFFNSKLNGNLWKQELNNLIKSYMYSQHGSLHDSLNQWDSFDGCWIYQKMREPDTLYFDVCIPQMFSRLYNIFGMPTALQLAAAEAIKNLRAKKTTMVTLSGLLEFIPDEMREKTASVGDMHLRAMSFKDSDDERAEFEKRVEKERNELKCVFSKYKKKVFISKWREDHFNSLIFDQAFSGCCNGD